jgi:hypothetical protein
MAFDPSTLGRKYVECDPGGRAEQRLAGFDGLLPVPEGVFHDHVHSGSSFAGLRVVEGTTGCLTSLNA